MIAKMCDRVLVMYGGKVAEKGTVEEIFYETAHPYTAGLIKSIATLDTSKDQKLVPIDGTPPDLFAPPAGCPFAARCEFAMQICYEKQPENYQISEEHMCACWLRHEYAPKVDIMKRGAGRADETGGINGADRTDDTAAANDTSRTNGMKRTGETSQSREEVRA